MRSENAGDVAKTLAFARRSGLPVAPRSGGHCFAGRSSTEGIVIDVGPISSVARVNRAYDPDNAFRFEQSR